MRTVGASSVVALELATADADEVPASRGRDLGGRPGPLVSSRAPLAIDSRSPLVDRRATSGAPGARSLAAPSFPARLLPLSSGTTAALGSTISMSESAEVERDRARLTGAGVGGRGRPTGRFDGSRLGLGSTVLIVTRGVRP